MELIALHSTSEEKCCGLDTNNTSKPAWAMTESVAKQKDQTIKQKEEEDMLSFVENLNFEVFANDIELKQLIDQVKSRINSLQREKNACEERLQIALDVSNLFIKSNLFFAICTLFITTAMKMLHSMRKE